MNATLVRPLLIVCFASGFAFGDDESPSRIPSKREDRKIEQATGDEVGRSAIDGITVSGKKAFVTRNGKTDELLEELLLDDGTRVFPDGAIRTEGGKLITLRQDQVLRFNGKIAVAPIATPVVPAPATIGTPQVSSGTPNVVGVVVGQPGSVTVPESVSGSGTVGSPGVVSGGFESGFLSVPLVVPQGTTVSGSALQATSVTTDPRTGQFVYSAVNPATGQLVTTTTDTRTNQSISTTTVSGQRISTTTNPQTGLPVTITTDSSGRTTATTVNPTTGQTVPAQYNAQTGQITNSQGSNIQPTNSQTQPGNLQQNPPSSTQQGQNQQPQGGTIPQNQTQPPTAPQPQSGVRPGTSGTGTTTTGQGTGTGSTRSGTSTNGGATPGGTNGASGASGSSGSTSGGSNGGASGGAPSGGGGR